MRDPAAGENLAMLPDVRLEGGFFCALKSSRRFCFQPLRRGPSPWASPLRVEERRGRPNSAHLSFAYRKEVMEHPREQP